jgi:hypothetical protein
VDEPENVIQDFRVVRLLLKPNQLIVDGVQALARLRQKLPQQIIHENPPSRIGVAAWSRAREPTWT